MSEHYDFIEEEYVEMADQTKVNQLRASLTREENKLPRQEAAVEATKGLIAVIRKELDAELNKK